MRRHGTGNAGAERRGAAQGEEAAQAPRKRKSIPAAPLCDAQTKFLGGRRSSGRQSMLEFFQLNRGIRVLRARRFEPPAQRRRRGILHMRAGMPIVRPPIRDQLRLEHVVVSIIDDRVEYYRAKRKLLYPDPR